MRWWMLLPALVATALLDVALMPMLSVAGCTAFTLPILLAFVGFYASRGAALRGAGGGAVAAAPSVVPAVGGVDAVPIIGPHVWRGPQRCGPWSRRAGCCTGATRSRWQ